jgi:hypothetical protein
MRCDRCLHGPRLFAEWPTPSRARGSNDGLGLITFTQATGGFHFDAVERNSIGILFWVAGMGAAVFTLDGGWGTRDFLILWGILLALPVGAALIQAS